jgi:GTP:adenosylcobinamide-phosphate guanylyltransferase
MDAVVTAGGIPQPGEPLYEETHGRSKALLDIGGKPMIQWGLDALEGAATIERVVIIGLDESSGVKCAKPLWFVPNHGAMIENIRAGIVKILEIHPQAHQVMIVSSDVPAIKPEMVDWVANNAAQSDDDMYYHVITRQVMEARYPGSRRTYTRLKNVEVCGADVNVVRAQTVTSNDALWKRIIDARKSPLQQASLLGFDTLLLILFRQLTVESAAKLASKRLKMRGRGVFSPYAELGMDVDKPHQLAMMREDLKRS